MNIGLSYFPTDYSIRAVPLARAMESRGLESLWITEHTHIPASLKTPHPAGIPVPPYYWQSYEPFTFLAQAAAVTENLRIGTGICLVPLHHPLSLAKRVASLDSLSDGRFLFGVGGGWNVEELENHGVDFSKRWRILKDYVLAMKQCWTQTDAEYHGEFADFDAVWLEPKPVTKPHPPVYIGAASRFAIERVVDFADGWSPTLKPGFDERLKELDRLCEQRGRDRRDIDVCVFTPTIDSRDRLAKFAEKGVSRVVLTLPTVSESESLKILDTFATVAGWAREISEPTYINGGR